MRRIVLAAALAVATQLVALAAGYLPLDTGNRWTYRVDGTRQTFTVTVGESSRIDGRIYVSLKGYVGDDLLVRYNENGSLVYRDEERGTDVLLTSFEVVPKAWFEAPLRPCSHEGHVEEQPGYYDRAAGPFSNTRLITYRGGCPDAAVVDEEYAENIGLVSRTVSTIAGPRTYELVYANVARAASVDALPHSGFSVGYARRPSEQLLDVTLRLAIDQGRPLTLRFPDTADAEVRVLDLDGRVLWSSLTDRAHAPRLRERATGYAEWSVPVPLMLPTGEILEPGKHLISGRLLTLGTLQFATVVPYGS